MSSSTDDIKQLLDQLDDNPPAIASILAESTKSEEKPEETSPASPVDPDLQELLNKLDEPETEENEEVATIQMAPVSVGETGIQTSIPEVQDPAQRVSPIDIVKVFQQYEAVSDEILTACRGDRQEAQDAIDLCKTQINNASNPNAVPRMYVDGLVKAIEVKSNINATAVKMIDTLAKLLAATKSQINISNTNNNLNVGDEKSLEDILSEPMDDSY